MGKSLWTRWLVTAPCDALWLTITGVKGLTEAQKATLQALGAIDESTFPV